MFKFALEHGLI